MAISNVSSGLRPGVCTSTTRPQAPFEGQMIFETDTNRVLIWDNAAWVMIADTDTPPGLQLVSNVSFTSATSASPVNVTGCFGSEFLNYKIVVTVTSGGANLEVVLQMLSGTTPATGGNYIYAALGIQSNGNANDYGGGRTGTSIGVTQTTQNGTVGTSLDIYQPFASRKTNFYGDWLYDDGGTFLYRRYGAIHDLANSYDGFRLYAASGNITGSVLVYGYRN